MIFFKTWKRSGFRLHKEEEITYFFGFQLPLLSFWELIVLWEQQGNILQATPIYLKDSLLLCFGFCNVLSRAHFRREMLITPAACNIGCYWFLANDAISGNFSQQKIDTLFNITLPLQGQLASISWFVQSAKIQSLFLNSGYFKRPIPPL